MSKAWKILESIGEIDDKFVLEGNEQPNKKPNRIVGLMPLAVACLVMVLAFVFFLTRQEYYTPPAFDITEWEHLPRLSVSNSVAWSGWQTTRASNPSELIGDNPWLSLTSTTLPVFRNPIVFDHSIDHTEEVLIETVKLIANHFDITIPRITRRKVEFGNDFYIYRWIEVSDVNLSNVIMRLDAFRGHITVSFDRLIPYSELEYLIATLPTVIDISEDESINAVLEYTFRRTLPTPDDIMVSGLRINLPNLLLSQYIGDYPIITPEEALEELLQGNYISTFHYTYWPGEELARNAHVELVYRDFELDNVFMPFYLFKIAIPEWHGVAELYEEHGIMTYGWWWVPAVHNELLLNWGNN